MSKRKIFDFLRDLRDNNDKEWFHANREAYDEAKGIWTDTVEVLLKRLAKHDDYYTSVAPNEAVERINNNLLYHPELPTYKTHFGFSPGQAHGTGLYVSVDPAYSFFGAGVHNPSNEALKKIRAKIDEDGKTLQDIINAEEIQDYFGGLEEDPKALKTSPRDYSQDHEFIELLRRKNFTVQQRITQDDVLSDNFPEMVEEMYLKAKPLLDWLRN